MTRASAAALASVLGSALGGVLGGALALGCGGEPGTARPGPAPSSSSAWVAVIAPATPPLAAALAPASALPAASAPGAPSAAHGPAAPGAALLHSRRIFAPIALDRARVPFFFTAAFDGSQRFGGWLETLAFARAIGAEHGRPARFTFFVNTCFFDTAEVPTTIGRARSRDEVLVRRALAQIAVNEGHEIASHGVGHHDGSTWDAARWKEELDTFHRVADGLVFEPVRDEEGRALFPRFSPLPGAPPRGAGSACRGDSDCEGARCADLGDAGRLCAPPCNLRQRCPEGLVCGAPFFRDDEDVCLPRPDFPVRLPEGPREDLQEPRQEQLHGQTPGEVLFDARGNARSGPRLRPLRPIGFRAPYLGANDAMLEALLARGYLYDTSLGTPPGMPRDVSLVRRGPSLIELGLAAWPGVRTVPMDYNYMQLKVPGARMAEDYRSSLVQAFAAGRVPFNVGHHFARWEGGAYQRALEDTVRFAAAGCPDAAGVARCPGAVLASFREVVAALDAARVPP